jgi:hypothetical protein
LPIFGIAGAGHDDQLFVRLAYHLGAGNWLGPYDPLILTKGMGYSLFILAAFAAGLPLKLAEQGLYLAAAALAAWLAARLTRNRWLAVAVFGGLAFNPMLWSWNLARVIREGEYVGLSLALFSLAASVLLIREPRSPATRFAFLAALGLVGGLFWVTREEGVWLAPALAVLVVAGAAGVWRERARRERGRLRTAAAIVGAAAIPAAAFAVVLGAVAGMNYRTYGVFIINELQAAPFRAAYGAVTRIRHDDWQRYIVFPKDAREKAYAVSAAARELRPSLDPPDNPMWFKKYCEEIRIERCTGVPAAWFVWILRGSAANAGHHASATAARAYYRRLAEEINGACDAGRIACLARRATLAPPFRWHYVGDAVSHVPSLTGILFGFAHGEIGTQPTLGPIYWIYRFEDLVGVLARAPTPAMFIKGTAAVKGEPVALAVEDRGGGSYRSEVKLEPSREPPSPAGERHVDFEVSTDCMRPSCALVVRVGAGEQGFPIAGFAHGAALSRGDVQLRIQQAFSVHRSGDPPVAGTLRRSILLRVMQMIAKVYAVTAPVLAAIAALGLLLAAVLPRQVAAPRGVVALALACGVAVATRIGLLAYIQATSFPALNALYLSPASPFLIMFIVLGVYLMALVIRAAVLARRPPVVPARGDQPTR